MMSTGGSSAPWSLVISPTWIMWGKCCLVTAMGKVSISLAQRVLIPCLDAANGKPPIPSNKLPIVNSYCSLLGMHLLLDLRSICQNDLNLLCGDHLYRMYNLPDGFFTPLRHVVIRLVQHHADLITAF